MPTNQRHLLPGGVARRNGPLDNEITPWMNDSYRLFWMHVRVSGFFSTLDAPCLKIPQCFHSAPRPPSFISSVTSFISPDKLPHTLSSFFKDFFRVFCFRERLTPFTFVNCSRAGGSSSWRVRTCLTCWGRSIPSARCRQFPPQLLICPRPFSPFFWVYHLFLSLYFIFIPISDILMNFFCSANLKSQKLAW